MNILKKILGVQRMFSYFFRLRYMIIFIIISTMLGAALIVSIGLVEVFEVYSMYFSNSPLAEEFVEISRKEVATLMMVGVLDSLLFGLVLIIFSYGIYILYIHDHSTGMELPEWLKIKDVEQLKKTLAQVIVIILFVKFLEITIETIAHQNGIFQWEHLVLPISIALLSLGLKVLFED